MSESHKFGSFVEIKVKEVMTSKPVSVQCGNDHSFDLVYPLKFCGHCRSKIVTKYEDSTEYPRLLGDLLDEKWDDILDDISPRKLWGTGVILACANVGPEVANWLYIDEPEYDPVVLEFPGFDEIQKMKGDLEGGYADVIEALVASRAVLSVKIKCGYVLVGQY